MGVGLQGRARMVRALLVGVMALWAAGPAGAQGSKTQAARSGNEPASPIIWRLENPFRFFTDPADTERHRQAFVTLTAAELAEPVLAIERRLAFGQPRGWAEGMVDRTCWDDRAARFGGCKGRPGDYINPASHRVLVRLRDPVPGAICTWRVVAGERQPVRRALCDDELAFSVPYPKGATLEVRWDGGRAAATIAVKDIFVVAVGDSFGSGDGNPDVPMVFDPTRTADYGLDPSGRRLEGYPTRIGGWAEIGDAAFMREGAKWLSTPCHRALYSHQTRAALQLAIENPQRAVTFINLSCAGSDITHGLFRLYQGSEWFPHRPSLSQLSAVADAQCGRRLPERMDYPVAFTLNDQMQDLKDLRLLRCDRNRARPIDLLFLSIGGNDVGFSSLVANAVLADQSALRRLGGWVGALRDSKGLKADLARLDLRYKALNRALHTVLHIPWREADRVILTAYPSLSLREDGTRICGDGRAGMTVLPAFAFNRKRALDGEQAADALYDRMQKAARTHGWSFADAHRVRFRGHGLCAVKPREALQAAEDLRFPLLQDGRWRPFAPQDFAPYATRQRWFRTPNDAYLIAHQHVGGAVLKRVSRLERVTWFQALLASTYSGAFHPTAEGQAAIADGVVVKAREVLKKYRQ